MPRYAIVRCGKTAITLSWHIYDGDDAMGQSGSPNHAFQSLAVAHSRRDADTTALPPDGDRYAMQRFGHGEIRKRD